MIKFLRKFFFPLKTLITAGQLVDETRYLVKTGSGWLVMVYYKGWLYQTFSLESPCKLNISEVEEIRALPE